MKIGQIKQRMQLVHIFQDKEGGSNVFPTNAQLLYTCTIIEYYIEHSGNKMNNLSINSNHSSQQSPNQSSSSHRHNNKHKYIKKDKRRRATTASISQRQSFQDIVEFVQQYGHQYFELTPNQLLSRFQTQFQKDLHIKTILSHQQNVYKINDHHLCDASSKQYLVLARIMSTMRHSRLQLTASKKRMMVQLCYQKIKGVSKHNIHLFTKSESLLMRKRREALKEIDLFLNRCSEQLRDRDQLDWIDKEILALCKINKIQQNSMSTQINHLVSKAKDNLKEIHLDSNNAQSLNDQYICLLINKNLRIALEETPLDLLNYFKVIQNTQKNIYDDKPLIRLENVAQLRQFLKNKKHKSGRHQQHSLKTCCAACFSNHYQIFNPIHTCVECGMRMHLHCQRIKGKCQRCKYMRKSIQEKSQSSFCTICKRDSQKGLLIQSITRKGKQQYAHTFCLLIHQMWTLHQSVIEQKIQQGTSFAQCKYCLKQGSVYLNCKCCGDKMHGMCAYLNGCSFNIQQDGTKVSCCQNARDQMRLSFERRFKLNYENILYLKTAELSRLIQSGIW